MAHFLTHSVDREPLRRYGHSKLSKMAAAAILNLFESKIAPLDPPSPKNPLYRIGLSSVLRPRQHSIGYMGDGPHSITKHEVDRTTGCGDMAI